MVAPDETLVDLYLDSVRRNAERPLFGVKRGGAWQWTTYAEFDALVAACRSGLAARGVGPGDTVAFISDNRIEWAVTAHATWQIGATFCPTFATSRLEDQAFILRDGGAKVVFLATTRMARRLEGTDLPEGLQMIRLDGGEDADGWEALLAEGRAAPTPVRAPAADDPADLIYTSGTTAEPKGVLLSHRNLASNVRMLQGPGVIQPEDVSLSFLPWAHVFGQTVELHLLFSMGSAIAISSSVATLLPNLKEVRPTVVFTVPRIFNLIYESVHDRIAEGGAVKRRLFEAALGNAQKLSEARDAGRAAPVREALDRVYDRLVLSKVREVFGGRLKYAISGGAALSPDVARFVDNTHLMVLEGYGLTETSPLVATNVPEARKIGSVGRPIAGQEVTIRPVEDHPPEVGEVCVRGPNVMVGYRGRPDATRAVVDPDGTFHTGDLGRIDDDGYLWIVGRVKEQYKLSNGKYVVPTQLEEAIKLSPFIDQVMVEGANRPHNVAVVRVNPARLDPWADERNIPEAGRLAHPLVHALIAEEIKRSLGTAKAFERPRDFLLVDDEWSVETGILTPALKLKRRVVQERYGARLDALFDETPQAAEA